MKKKYLEPEPVKKGLAPRHCLLLLIFPRPRPPIIIPPSPSTPTCPPPRPLPSYCPPSPHPSRSMSP